MIRALKKFEDMTPEDWEENDRHVKATAVREAAEATAKQRHDRIAAMEIPPRALEVADGKLLESDARRLIRGGAVITCLSGNPGTGKTVAACEWLLTHEKGLFVKAASLARLDRSHVAKILHAPVLVLDDLGAEYQDVKGHLASLLDELVDHRYDWRLPLVMTTNLNEKDFKERYRERIVDRIRELGRFIVIGGSSMRARRP